MEILSQKTDLVDPVPYRWEQLLTFNGVTKKEDLPLYETVIDGAPIAAPDNAGAYIPIDAFSDYQEEIGKAAFEPGPQPRVHYPDCGVWGACHDDA